jgi:glycosyltransferase involved in cell wall biosynthesis
VEVAWFYESDFFQPYLDSNDISTKHLFSKKPLVQIKKIWQEIKSFKPDVVIAYMEGAALIASAIRYIDHSFVLIASERNVTWENTFKRRVRFALYSKTDFIVPNSYTQEELIKSRYPKLSDKVLTIPNYTDLELFSPVRKRNNLDELRVLVVGRINANKNTIRFIKAIKSIVKEIKPSHIKIDWYGNPHSGEYYESCIKEIDDGLKGIFEIHSPVKDILSCYQHSDIFCLPSLSEGFPNALSEAMCCGLPVVCSNVCDNGIIVRNGIDGFLFDPLDISDMANKLTMMVNLSPEQRDEMGRNSRHRAEELFNKEVFVEQYIDLIENR